MLYVGWLLIYSLALHNLLEDAMSILLLGFALARSYRIQTATIGSKRQARFPLPSQHELQRI